MVCTECVTDFFYNPVKLSIVLISFSLAIGTFFLFRKKNLSLNKKLGLMYSHIFFFVFPFVFYAFFRGCETYFSSCNKLKPILIMIGLTSFIAVILGLLIAPILFIISYKRKSVNYNLGWAKNFIERYSEILDIKKSSLFIVDLAKPMAFSISLLRPKIFISIGLMELLTKKEIEAVLLHELGHIKNRTSLFKFGSFFTSVISPLARFTTFSDDLDKEERRADGVVVGVQKTSKYLNSAKEKIGLFDCW